MSEGVCERECVCVCMRMHAYVCVYVRVYKCVCVCVCIRVWVTNAGTTVVHNWFVHSEARGWG